jgi:hypothetical protein
LYQITRRNIPEDIFNVAALVTKTKIPNARAEIRTRQSKSVVNGFGITARPKHYPSHNRSRSVFRVTFV